MHSPRTIFAHEFVVFFRKLHADKSHLFGGLGNGVQNSLARVMRPRVRFFARHFVPLLFPSMNAFPFFRFAVGALFGLFLLSTVRTKAADLGANGPLYETNVKPMKDFTLECWFKVDPLCPEGAYLFDKLIGDDRTACRLEIHGGTARLVNTAGDVTEAPLPNAGQSVHLLAFIDRTHKQQSLYINGTPPVTTPFSVAVAVSKEEGPVRLGGDLAGEHRFVGEINRFSIYSRPPQDEIMAAFDLPANLVSKLAWGEYARWNLDAATGTGPVPAWGPVLPWSWAARFRPTQRRRKIT
jgi:hypothetical protein